MRLALADTIQFLNSEQLIPFVYGSFAICLYADRFLLDVHDIDLAFDTRHAHDRAVQLLENERSCIRLEQSEWESCSGEWSVNTKIRSPLGVVFDASYTKGDLDLTLDPYRTILVNNVHVPVLSINGLKKSYRRFFDEKPDAHQKITLLDDLTD